MYGTVFDATAIYDKETTGRNKLKPAGYQRKFWLVSVIRKNKRVIGYTEFL